MFASVLLTSTVSFGQPSMDAGTSNGHSEDPEDPEDPPPTTVGDAGTMLNVTVRTLVADAAVPIAAGRGVIVTAAELIQQVRDTPETVLRQWANDTALIDALLDRIVSDRLLVIEARRRGLENDPYVRAALERALVARLRSTVINPSVGGPESVSDDQVRTYYETHQDRFSVPERRTARVIFVRDRRTAERVLRQARAARNRRAVPRFNELLQQFTDDPELRRRNGELRDITRNQPGIDAPLRNAIFEVRATGTLLGRIIRGEWRGTPGFFVVRLIARRPPIVRSITDSEDWIRHRLTFERRIEAERSMVQRLATETGVVRQPTANVVSVSVQAGPNAPAIPEHDASVTLWTPGSFTVAQPQPDASH